MGATTLQLLHQHFTAAPQSVSELPKGAAAPQGATAVLWCGHACLSCWLHSLPAHPNPYSPHSTRLQALPPQRQTQTEPQHPRPHLGCHGGLPAHHCHLSAVPPPWSGLQGPGPKEVEGILGEKQGQVGPCPVLRSVAHLLAAAAGTVLQCVCSFQLALAPVQGPQAAQGGVDCGAVDRQWDSLKFCVPQEPGPILAASPY